MLARVVEFVEVLRHNGVRVAITETQDAAQALGAVGLTDPALVRAALRSTLIKRLADVEAFDRAFDAFFLGTGQTAAPAWSWAPGTAPVPTDAERLASPEASPLLQALLAPDPGEALRLLREAPARMDWSRLQTPLQTGFLARRLFSGMGGDGVPAEIFALKPSSDDAEDVATLEALQRTARARLAGLEAFTRRFVQDQVRARLRPRTDSVVDRPLASLTAAEVQSAERAVRKLAERLKARLSVRHAVRRQGTLHVRRTLRQNLSWGGIPMRPAFRQKRPARPDVMVLCDVSDSVRNASRMMLLFMYTLQALFTRVRSFIFVAELGEVSEVFRTLPLQDAINAALTGDTISLYSNSNYGQALSEFAHGYLGGITSKTTVLILGDGRNNNNPPNDWVLDQVHRRARRVIWLCTEDPRGWGVGDSEMRRYLPHCDQVLTVLTLRDLERAAEAILPVP